MIGGAARHCLTHWGRVTHICVSKLTIIGSDNGLSPGRRQAIIWTNVGILLIRTLGTNFSEMLGEIHSFSFSKKHLKMSSAKWRLFGLGLNELISTDIDWECFFKYDYYHHYICFVICLLHLTKEPVRSIKNNVFVIKNKHWTILLHANN